MLSGARKLELIQVIICSNYRLIRLEAKKRCEYYVNHPISSRSVNPISSGKTTLS